MVFYRVDLGDRVQAMEFPDDYIDRILCGDALAVLGGMPDEIVQTCITSPPYWGLRDYGLEPVIWGDSDCEHKWETAPARRQRSVSDIKDPDSKEATKAASAYTASGGQFCVKCGAWLGTLGLEPSPELYIEHLVQIFREVRRVLRKDGTCWINIGDSYWGGKGRSGYELPHEADERRAKCETMQHGHNVPGYMDMRPADGTHHTIKPKDMVLIPFRLALALEADGWWVRSDIIWAKNNPMPESVRDRPTKSHEYVFLLAKSKHYYYDQDAIREPLNRWGGDTIKEETPKHSKYLEMQGIGASSAMRAGRPMRPDSSGRNKRTVWTIPTVPYPGAHFAVFPAKLIEPMILAGSSDKACPHCGAAWVRISSKTTTFEGGSGRAGRTAEQVNEQGKWKGKQYGKNIKLGPVLHVETTGFQPSCDCPDNDGSDASIVLDPFAGSCTTCAESKRLGRHYIGIEANPDYILLGERRIAETVYQPEMF